MNQITGSALILAGTAIGAGMIALPMTLSKIGLFAGLIALLLIWASVYYSALATTELSLRAHKASSIGVLAKRFSGPSLEWICQICMLLLTYALMVAYLGGGTSIIDSLLHHFLGEQSPDQGNILLGFTVFLYITLVLKTKWIDSINRILFFGLILTLVIVISTIAIHLQPGNLPWVSEHMTDAPSWFILLPVVFTSFGFQLTIPTIIDYLGLSAENIKKSLLWGSLIPVIVYLIWTFVTLGIIYQSDPESYHQTLQQGGDVGHFVDVLSHVTQWQGLRFMSWIISILALVTSAIGVGLGIKSFWQEKLSHKFPEHASKIPFLNGLLVVIVPYLISHALKDSFLQALAFAGMILVTLSILIPVYLLFKSDHLPNKSDYRLLQNIPLRIMVFLFGLFIFVSEIINILR